MYAPLGDHPHRPPTAGVWTLNDEPGIATRPDFREWLAPPFRRRALLQSPA